MPREHSAAAADRPRITHLTNPRGTTIRMIPCTASTSRETRPKIVTERTELTAKLSDRVTD
jgi:hypothetical protein